MKNKPFEEKIKWPVSVEKPRLLKKTPPQRMRKTVLNLTQRLDHMVRDIAKN